MLDAALLRSQPLRASTLSITFIYWGYLSNSCPLPMPMEHIIKRDNSASVSWDICGQDDPFPLAPPNNDYWTNNPLLGGAKGKGSS